MAVKSRMSNTYVLYGGVVFIFIGLFGPDGRFGFVEIATGIFLIVTAKLRERRDRAKEQRMDHILQNDEPIELSKHSKDEIHR